MIAHDSVASLRHMRQLMAILFLDLVSSTQAVVRLGDAQWRRFLDSLDAMVGLHLARFGGTLVNRRGDDVLAVFAGATAAIECARAIRASLGVAIRAGVHVGECERRGGDVAGVAVHLAARVMEQAKPGQILVSSTVRDLVAGSGLVFEDCGRKPLRGLPGRFRLQEVAS